MNNNVSPNPNIGEPPNNKIFTTPDPFILDTTARLAVLEERVSNIKDTQKSDYERANNAFKDIKDDLKVMNERLAKLEFTKTKLAGIILGGSAVTGLLVSIISWIVNKYF